MSAHFSIDMLPAREGDCLWIEYGDGGRTHRILVDGGRSSAYDTVSQRIAALPPDERAFELLVCTHVDADHIEGLLKLVEDPALDATFRDVWFNGFVHLKRPTGAEMFGAKQGERLSDGIVERRWSWNKAFGHGSVVVPDEGGLPVLALDGGMSITLLSPTWDKLERLRPTWKRECEKAGIVPGVAPVTEPPDGIERFGALNADTVLELAAAAFRKDTSRANGSSIAFLASFGGKTPRQMHPAACADCGQMTEVPFVPRGERPVAFTLMRIEPRRLRMVAQPPSCNPQAVTFSGCTSSTSSGTK